MLIQRWRDLGLIERMFAVLDTPLQTLHGQGVGFLDCQIAELAQFCASFHVLRARILIQP
ncbi:hypothetical protein ABZ924_37040 [Streptomyces sp. NPDC046876]|uniref:hypothetical protein n=1 Tax=Streptomyces sp. NPDC046876 TaxID=3155616 RepID=UPI0033E48225